MTVCEEKVLLEFAPAKLTIAAVLICDAESQELQTRWITLFGGDHPRLPLGEYSENKSSKKSCSYCFFVAIFALQ